MTQEPLFVFALAYNLSRPEKLARGAYTRTMKRLAPLHTPLLGLAVFRPDGGRYISSLHFFSVL